MSKVSMTIFINTDSPDIFIKMIKAICWVFGDKDFIWKSPYSITYNVEEIDRR